LLALQPNRGDLFRFIDEITVDAARHGNFLEPSQVRTVRAVDNEMIEPLPDREPELRDADEQLLQGTLLAAMHLVAADHLVAGDMYLLALAEGFPSAVPAAFWAAHGGL
jgi:hypothetical protein